MSTLVERLIGLIQATWAYLIPWVILGDDEVGLVRRIGKYRRPLIPGWNWKWPLLETTEVACSALDTTVLREQSLTTADGSQVTIRGVVTYRVVNARRYCLDCATASSVLSDAVLGVLAEIVPMHTADVVLRDPTFTRELSKRVRMRAKRWGVDVESVSLADRTKAKTFRIISSAAPDEAQ